MSPAGDSWVGRLDLRPAGDTALRVGLSAGDDPRRVPTVSAALAAAGLPGVVECVPGLAAVTVYYDPSRTSYTELCARVRQVAERAAPPLAASARRVTLPVVYGGEHGPDLADVAAHCGLDPAEVIARHSGAVYVVQLLGFAPGFAYLAGLPPSLATPRLATPRRAVPAGSLGIGGAQTGVYPSETPGGWRLIGRCPLPLYEPQQTPPVLLSAGDEVRFAPVSAADFAPLTRGAGRAP